MATAHVSYAYSRRENINSQGKYHLVLNDGTFAAGRYHRSRGEALCPKRRHFWGLDERPEMTQATCPGCVSAAARHGITIAASTPTAQSTHPRTTPKQEATAMTAYTVTVVCNGEQTTRIAAGSSDLHSLVRTFFYADGRKPTATDHAVIAHAVGNATAMVDDTGVANVDLGAGTSFTLQPHPSI